MAKAKTKKPKRKPSAYNKHVGREMRAGKTMKQAAASWKRKGSKKSSPKKTDKSNPKGGTRNVTKNSFNMNKIYGLIRKGAVFLPAISIAMMNVSNATKLTMAQKWYFGWDPVTGKMVWNQLLRGWGPAIGAQIVTRIIPAISKIIRGLF